MVVCLDESRSLQLIHEKRSIRDSALRIFRQARYLLLPRSACRSSRSMVRLKTLAASYQPVFDGSDRGCRELGNFFDRVIERVPLGQ